MANPSKIVRFSVVAAGVTYAGALYLSGVRLDQDIKQALSYLPSLAALGIILFDKWLWKWPVVRLLHSKPRLDGLWKAELKPDKKSRIPAGGNSGPVAAYVIIEQTFWSICVTQLTAESSSMSRATAFITRMDSGRQILTFTYDNEVRREHLPRSPRHRGACELTVSKGAPVKVTGYYFTDRFTAGDIEMTLIDRTIDYVDFEAAEVYQRKVVAVS